MQRVVAAYTARVPTPSTAAEGCPAPAPLLYAIGMHTRAGMATAPATAETAGHAAAPAGDAPADASTAPAAAGGSTEAKEAAAGAAVAGTGADSAAAGTVPKGTLDRPEAIKLMAPALEAAMSAAGYGPMKVNLTQPHLSLMVEAVPVGAHGNYLAGLCLLSKEAFSAKPKLLVKSLASTVGGGHMPAPAVRSKKQEKRDKKGKKGGEGKEAEVQA